MAIDPPYRLDPFRNIINVHWKEEEETTAGTGYYHWIQYITIGLSQSIGQQSNNTYAPYEIWHRCLSWNEPPYEDVSPIYVREASVTGTTWWNVGSPTTETLWSFDGGPPPTPVESAYKGYQMILEVGVSGNMVTGSVRGIYSPGQIQIFYVLDCYNPPQWYFIGAGWRWGGYQTAGTFSYTFPDHPPGNEAATSYGDAFIYGTPTAFSATIGQRYRTAQ